MSNTHYSSKNQSRYSKRKTEVYQFFEYNRNNSERFEWTTPNATWCENVLKELTMLFSVGQRIVIIYHSNNRDTPQYVARQPFKLVISGFSLSHNIAYGLFRRCTNKSRRARAFGMIGRDSELGNSNENHRLVVRYPHLSNVLEQCVRKNGCLNTFITLNTSTLAFGKHSNVFVVRTYTEYVTYSYYNAYIDEHNIV